MNEKKYHPYVFDTINHKFVGKFESMYADESVNGFDSWHERDLRMLRKQLSLVVLSQYNFSNILELGCGKGTLTQFFKKKNNLVTAIDISQTAISKGLQSYPDINFVVSDILGYINLIKASPQKFDLTVVMGTLAYVNNYSNILEKLAKHTDYLFVNEFIPDNPIGFVKSIDDLVNVVTKYFSLETKIILDEKNIFLLGKSKK